MRLRRLRVLPACVGAVGESVGVLLLGRDVYFCLLPRCVPSFGTNNFWFYKQWKNISRLTARRHLILLTKECRRKMKHLRKELTFYKNRLAEHCNEEPFSFYSTRIDSMALSLESLLAERRAHKNYLTNQTSRVTLVRKVKSNFPVCKSCLKSRVRGQFEIESLILRLTNTTSYFLCVKKSWTWSCNHLKVVTSQRITSKHSTSVGRDTWVRDAVRWWWSADAVVWQLSIDWTSLEWRVFELLVSSVTPFKIDQNKN